MDQESQKHPKQKIAFLYLKTGGGHFSAAKSLYEAVEYAYSDRAEAVVFDPIPKNSFFAQRLLQDGYRFFSHKIGIFWILLYEISKIRVVDIIWSFFVYITIRKNLMRFIMEENIDTIVILHFLLSRPLQWTLKKIGKKLDTIRIVTDPFTAHNLWFNCPEIHTIIFSNRLQETVRKEYPQFTDTLHVFPPILRSGINLTDPKEINKELGSLIEASGDKKLLLFAGGGEGFPKGLKYISHLLNSGCNHRIVLVCGRDKSLKKAAERIKSRHRSVDLTIFGYVDFMAALMRIADIVITKGGPATIMEVLKDGKPVIVVQYLYGQERGNMEYVAENGFGYYASSPREMSSRINQLLENPKLYSDIVSKIATSKPENGTHAILEYIISFNA